MEQKSKKVYKIVAIIALLLIIIGVAFMFINNRNSEDNSQKANVITNDIDNNLSYDDLEKELIEKINKDEMQVYIVECAEKDNKLESSNKKLSAETVSLFFKKLKQATSIESGTIEAYCPKYTYLLTTDVNDEEKTILAAWYGNDGNTLLFGLQKEGFIATFNENELNGFLEGLK